MLAQQLRSAAYYQPQTRTQVRPATSSRTNASKANEEFDNETLYNTTDEMSIAGNPEPTPDEVEQSVQAWMRRAGHVALLTHAQEIALARMIESARTEAEYKRARNTLISANLPLAPSVARRYQSYGIPLEDLIQEGTIGLVNAVERFRHE